MLCIPTNRKSYQFEVTVGLEELSSVPFVNGVMFAKLRILDSRNTKQYSSRQSISNHVISWNSTHKFTCRIFANMQTNMLDHSQLKVSIRKESKGGKSYLKMGYVIVNISCFANYGSKPCRRRYILEAYNQDKTRQDNSMLEMTFTVCQLFGDPCFRVPEEDLSKCVPYEPTVVCNSTVLSSGHSMLRHYDQHPHHSTGSSLDEDDDDDDDLNAHLDDACLDVDRDGDDDAAQLALDMHQSDAQQWGSVINSAHLPSCGAEMNSSDHRLVSGSPSTTASQSTQNFPNSDYLLPDSTTPRGLVAPLGDQYNNLYITSKVNMDSPVNETNDFWPLNSERMMNTDESLLRLLNSACQTVPKQNYQMYRGGVVGPGSAGLVGSSELVQADYGYSTCPTGGSSGTAAGGGGTRRGHLRLASGTSVRGALATIVTTGGGPAARVVVGSVSRPRPAPLSHSSGYGSHSRQSSTGCDSNSFSCTNTTSKSNLASLNNNLDICDELNSSEIMPLTLSNLTQNDHSNN